MTYDFRLIFSGLCLFHLPESGPRSPQVLLVKATDPDSVPEFRELEPAVMPHPHKPRLVVDPRYLDTEISRKPDGLNVGSDGFDYPLFDIEFQNIEVSIPGASSLDVTRGRRPGSGDPYRSPDDDEAQKDWFDWVISVPHVSKSTSSAGVGNLKRECWGDLTTPDCPVISRVKLSGGKLRTHTHSREGKDYMVYNYLDLSNTPSDEKPHVFADTVKLEGSDIPNDVAVALDTGHKGIVFLKPPAGTSEKSLVTASITNFDVSFQPARKRIYDFLWYYTLYNRQAKPLNWPVPRPEGTSRSLYTPSTTTCPPGGG
ncbi:MAG TPA: hypothetical protein VNB06_18445 [Thermoanaerobaculia bacterium]|nr:hypothetical protein [Thermoanaerobaculia bacterium]